MRISVSTTKKSKPVVSVHRAILGRKDFFIFTQRPARLNARLNDVSRAGRSGGRKVY